MPRDDILELRAQVLALVRAEGLLAEGTETLDGIADVAASRKRAGYGVSCGTKALYEAVQLLPHFQAMARQHGSVLLEKLDLKVSIEIWLEQHS